MSKIVVFKGSPNKNGYTTKLLQQVVKGAKSKGAEVIEFDLNNPGIRGCQGISAEGIKYITDLFKTYGWILEDSIHYCGTTNPDLTVLEELSSRAFKDGENLSWIMHRRFYLTAFSPYLGSVHCPTLLSLLAFINNKYPAM